MHVLLYACDTDKYTLATLYQVFIWGDFEHFRAAWTRCDLVLSYRS